MSDVELAYKTPEPIQNIPEYVKPIQFYPSWSEYISKNYQFATGQAFTNGTATVYTVPVGYEFHMFNLIFGDTAGGVVGGAINFGFNSLTIGGTLWTYIINSDTGGAASTNSIVMPWSFPVPIILHENQTISITGMGGYNTCWATVQGFLVPKNA